MGSSLPEHTPWYHSKYSTSLEALSTFDFRLYFNPNESQLYFPFNRNRSVSSANVHFWRASDPITEVKREVQHVLAHLKDLQIKSMHLLTRLSITALFGAILLQQSFVYAPIRILWWEPNDILVAPGTTLRVPAHLGEYSTDLMCTEVLFRKITQRTIERVMATSGLTEGQVQLPIESDYSQPERITQNQFRIRFACCVVKYIRYFYNDNRCSPSFYMNCPPRYTVKTEIGQRRNHWLRNKRAKCVPPEEIQQEPMHVQVQGGTSRCLNPAAPSYIPQSTVMQAGMYIPDNKGGVIHIPILYMKLYQRHVHGQKTSERLIRQGDESDPLILQLPKLEQSFQTTEPQYSLCLTSPAPEVDLVFSALIAPAA